MTWADAVNKLLSLPEMVLDKLRINVVIVALLVTWIIVDFGDKLIQLLQDANVDPQLIITVIVGLIGTGVGGLIAAMIRMFESPNVPADLHERVVKNLMDK